MAAARDHGDPAGRDAEAPHGTVWIIRVPGPNRSERLVAKDFGTERKPSHRNGLLQEHQELVSGPYADRYVAVQRATSDRWYPHLLRVALRQGITRRSGIHESPSLREIARWTGYSARTLERFLQARTSRTWRKLPRSALRLILHELALHDHCKHGHSAYFPARYDCEMCPLRYDWTVLLRECR